ncbi:MAG: ABC transporter substrate-binding protein [Granulosicoccus sp.]
MKTSKLVTMFASAALVCSVGTAAAMEKIVFQLGWLPGGNYAPLYVGIDQGIFEAAGFDVSIQSGRGAADVITKMSTGTSDIGISAFGGLLRSHVKGNDQIKAVYSVYTQQPDSIITYEGSGIETLADVSGKKIATSANSASNFSWPIVLQNNGVDPDSVTLIKSDPKTLAPMLATGQADAVIAFSTNGPSYSEILGKADKSIVILPWSEFGFDGYSHMLYATPEMINDRTEALKGFLAAYTTSVKAAMADHEAAADSVVAVAPQLDRDVALKQWESALALIDNAVSQASGLGQIDENRVKATWEWAAKAQSLEMDTIDPMDAVALGFVE